MKLNSWCRNRLTIIICGCAMVWTTYAYAGHRVVVIPLGEDAPNLTPPMPVTKLSPNQSDYIIQSTTVIDNVTRLEWQRIDDGVRRNWLSARAYCLELSLNNKQDWRLPNVLELLSIVDFEGEGRLINQIAFPSTNENFNYWSSVDSPTNVNSAYWISFRSGGFGALISGNLIEKAVRCVR